MVDERGQAGDGGERGAGGERRAGRRWDRWLSRLVDLTVVRSFDRTGYEVHRRLFDPADTDVDLRGRVCLVTGANSGLGRATARELLDRGARVYLLCRDAGRGAEARDSLRAETGNAEARLALVDLASLDSVRDFALGLDELRVDVLVHNAGVLPAARTKSPDGLELTWATHLAGPHLLTGLLLPKLRVAPQARVLFVSSGGMYTRALELDDIFWRRRPYDGVVAYAQTKRAQVVLAELWAEGLRSTAITINSMHPGWADTPAVASSLPRFHRAMKRRLRTAEQGADTIVWLAICPRLARESGGFWFDRQRRATHYLPWTKESARARTALWRLLCAQTGVCEHPLADGLDVTRGVAVAADPSTID